MKTLIVSLVLVITPMLASAASLRCGSQLIVVGTSSAELQALCGVPTQVSNGGMYGASGGRRVASGVPADAVEDLQVETWTYNFGPNQLMERIRIENGIVVQIDSMGYGYNEP